VFHADPHPGNFMIVDGGRVALLDFGCVMRLPDAVRRAYAGLVLAIFARDAARAAALFDVLGFDGDPAALRELAELILDSLRQDADLARVDSAAQLERALAVLSASPLARVPHHFVLVGRVLASLGGLVLKYPPRRGIFPVLAPRLALAMQEV